MVNAEGDTMTEYGEMIRMYRTQAGLTQKKLGMLCGYDESTADSMVRGWEAGKSLPPLRVLRRLATALNVPLDTLIP